MFSAGRSWIPPCLRRALALSGAADRPGEPKIPPGGTIAHVKVIRWLPTLSAETTPVSARTPGPRRRPELSDQFGQRGLSHRQRQVARAALRQASERQQHQQRLVQRPLPVPLILAQRREPAQHASSSVTGGRAHHHDHSLAQTPAIHLGQDGTTAAFPARLLPAILLATRRRRGPIP